MAHHYPDEYEKCLILFSISPQFRFQKGAWTITHKNWIRWRNNTSEEQWWHPNMGWRHTGKSTHMLYSCCNIHEPISIPCRDNDCWQCRVRIKLHVGTLSECKAPYWPQSFSQFIYIRSYWAACCIQRICTGKFNIFNFNCSPISLSPYSTCLNLYSILLALPSKLSD